MRYKVLLNWGGGSHSEVGYSYFQIDYHGDEALERVYSAKLPEVEVANINNLADSADRQGIWTSLISAIPAIVQTIPNVS